jgi:alpha-glucosidase
MTDKLNSEAISRRGALKRLSAVASGAYFAGAFRGASADIIVGGKPVEIAVWSLSPTTVRITVSPIVDGTRTPVPVTGALIVDDKARPMARGIEASSVARVRARDVVVKFTASPPSLAIETARGEVLQRLVLSAETSDVSFLVGKGPLLGFGEGGAQFDRKGVVDQMRNGQVSNNTYRLSTHGTRAPVQWLIGTEDGWAMFIHQPYGTFDLTGPEGKFTPAPQRAFGGEAGVVGAASPTPTQLATNSPLDVFLVASRDPKVIMREYAMITGFQEMPARWTLGYQQSHRTLSGPDEILSVARTMREKKLPCDTLIYLGTEFTPSGWNTRNGEFAWKPENFPNPKQMFDELHGRHFRVVLHVVIEGRTLTGSVTDPCTDPSQPSGRNAQNQWPPDRTAACYWPTHKGVFDQVGIDGWWPDQGDGLDGASRLNRHRMYWEGMQQWVPNERPFALHRNASPGIQRYGGYIWSGDTQGLWRTLQLHVPIGINSGLSGFPLWGSDIGGFYPTAEYTGELQVRWFQFGAFCPSFRCHGRNWHLRLPWGWDGGDGGPFETGPNGSFRVDPAELNNKQVEPILRKYLELRMRLMPYTYSALRETQQTGMPMMRALWLHHADDATAVARGDEYLWGPDILVAPVVEKGATSRRVYLPRGLL